MWIELEKISLDGTQSRAELNGSTVAEYKDAIERKVKLPPVVVFHDGSARWLADGFHRYFAHKAAGETSIQVDVRPGTKDDAILFSAAANATHGLPRTQADKRRAVQMVLDSPSAEGWSDRQIAKHVGVSHPFVAAVRNPEVAQRQQDNRAKSKPYAEVESDSTDAEVESGPKPDRRRKLDMGRPSEATDDATSDDEANELRDALDALAQENAALKDRLAVEAMDASEDERTLAAQTIDGLRKQVESLSCELSAVKASRDSYMRESAEKDRQITYWKRQAKKAEVSA